MSCTTIRERYRPQVLAAGAMIKVPSQSIGGFLCVTAGTISVVNYAGSMLLQDFPVTAGTFHRIPLYLGENGGTVTLDGGASGTLCI